MSKTPTRDKDRSESKPEGQKFAKYTDLVKPHECYIHDKVRDWKAEGIRASVCVNDEGLMEHTDGNHYCLFHLPTKDKDSGKFEEKFRARLQWVQDKFGETEKLPEEEREEAKSNISYDFRYVWFPSSVDLKKYIFSADANFSSATFSADANFSSATFSADANFSSATFSASADFNSATFSSYANFSEATFSGGAYFISAKFSGSAYFESATFSTATNFWLATFSADANFSSATFSANANFRSATFSSYANFSSATFDEKFLVFFKETKLNGITNFNYANFKGHVLFEGKQDNRVFGKNGLLDLQNARIDDARKISFHTVRLEPGWFINTDATGFVFTDCTWRYADGNSLKTKTELKYLKTREFDNPNALLTKACWQLAVNHEESKSFAKSSLFRTLANESKRLESPWYKQPFSLHWWYYAVSFYGENWRQALVVLGAILIVFGLLYSSSFMKFDYGGNGRIFEESYSNRFCEDRARIDFSLTKGKYSSMNVCEGQIHSLSVASFQRPEPKPATAFTKLFVTLETIFAPLQVALLVLAIRRKFMR